MTTIPRARRFACAAVALVGAALLLHEQVAQALVSRGDEAFRAGDVPRALRAYERATWLDPTEALAADRLAFFLALQHRASAAERAIVVATNALRAGRDASLYADRAFAEMELKRWTAAADDFGEAGALARDARYEHLAGRMALRNGDRSAAHRYATRAVAFDPAFAPARALQREVR